MGTQWSLSQEEEDLHRQRLFRKVRKGDEKAKLELQEVYACDSGQSMNVQSWHIKFHELPNAVNRRLERNRTWIWATRTPAFF
jgi:hypothetical protein